MQNKRLIVLFAAVAALILFAFPVFAGGGQESSEEPVSSIAVEGQLESQMLAEMVAAGELEPLERRLPDNPLVETVLEEIGVHGGVMRKVWRGSGKDKWGVTKMMEEYLLRYENGEMVPNVAESFEALDDSSRFVFHLREGMRWSDGVPFTAKDVLFFWEEVLLTEATGNGPHSVLRGATVTLIDDYTFEISFPEPRHLFPIEFMNQREFFTPAHYARTILPNFIGADAAAAMAQEQGFSDAQAMVKQKLYYFWLYPDVPKLTAWIPANDDTDNIYILRRNPYYWKVDGEGKQLPYIDEIHYFRMEDTEGYVLRAIAGDLDFQFRSMEVDDFTLFKENEDRGNYRTLVWQSVTNRCLVFNPTVEDPVLRGLFQDVRFRQAVSSAINRAEILEFTDSMAVPKQASFIEDSPYYREEWATAYADYDPDLANSLLDSIGLEWDDDRRFRVRPDGDVLEIIFLHRLTRQSELATVELVADYLAEIGLKVVARQVDRTLLEELRDTNQLEMSINEFQELDLLIDNKAYVPTRAEETHWGLYGEYVQSGGTDGLEPQGDMALLVEYWNNLNAFGPGPERDRWANEIVDLHMENLWMIGIWGLSPKLAIVNENMGNVASGVLDADILRTPGNAKPWQFFYRQ